MNRPFFIIFEGLDRCGKDTQIALLRSYLQFDIIHTLKYSNIKLVNHENVANYSKLLYKDMFLLLKNAMRTNHNFILNRSHIGEYVYSRIYRGYDGSYIFDYEKKYLRYVENNIYLIVFIDDVQNLLNRDDGLSLSNKNSDMISLERTMFIDAYNKTFIKNKILINIANQDINSIHEKIVNFLNT